jgi:ectoine hydroxylase-related dioxygenase (phytanoyl-CoA dioxygenase family)
MMDDMGIENGPLLVIPGSHKGKIYDHHSKGVFVGGFDPNKIGLDVSNAVPLIGPAGAITIHHVRAIHGSALNVSDRDRRLLLLQYRAADAWPLLAEEQKSMEAYDAMMVTGVPREPRLEDVPVMIPHYPATYKPGAGIYAVQKAAESKFFGVVEPAKVKAGAM